MSRTISLRNKLEPGDRLPAERQLSEALGVSRTILREALKSLQAIGVLDIRGGGGAFITSLDYLCILDQLSFMLQLHKGQFEHLVKFRFVIESGALEDIVNNMKDEDYSRLEKIARRMETSSTLEEQASTDLEFHRELVATTHNPLLEALSSFFSEFFSRVYAQYSAGRERR